MGTSNAPQISFRTLEKWEPLTPAAERAAEQFLKAGVPQDLESGWIKCAGYETLRQQITEYCEGRTQGHSFLISGHRGSGKTLLTHLAIQAVQCEARKRIEQATPGARPTMRIPFLVPLHGPDVLSSEKQGPVPEVVHSGVQQIVLALHRAYVEEILRRFKTASPNPLAVADLVVQLNHFPEVTQLYAIWEDAGLLKSGGVLRNKLEDQGFSEIVALHTLNEAVQAEWKDVDLSLKLGAIEASSPSSVDKALGRDNGDVRLRLRTLSHFVHVIAPVLSLAAGFLAAYYASKTLKDPLLEGVAFLATTFTAYRLLSATPAEPTSGFADRSSLSAMDRLLPVLVDRVMASGFAPVFVMDELDKLPDLQDRLAGFIRHLKYFVTDRAVFCFLTDRKYFETFTTRLLVRPYATEETFFAERILIHYDLDKFYDYLKEILAPGPKSQMEYQLLRRSLVFLSRVHPNVLRQYLNANRENTPQGAQVRFAGASCWRVPGYLMTAYMQIAIEAIFRQDDVSYRIRQRPEFNQWVLDTLYYPASCWEQGRASFSTTKSDLKKYLLRQLGFDEDRSTRYDRDGKQLDIVSESDLEFLWNKLNDFVRFLVNPTHGDLSILAVVKKFAGDEMDGLAAQLITCLVFPPAVEDVDASSSVKWRVDRFGNSLRGFASELDSYLVSISTGNLPNVAKQRFKRLVNHESRIKTIWPDYEYSPLLSTTHLSNLPAQQCEELTETELKQAVVILSEALDAERSVCDPARLGDLKKAMLEAVLLRSQKAPADPKPKLSKDNLATQIATLSNTHAQLERCLERFWQIDRLDEWEYDLIAIKKAI